MALTENIKHAHLNVTTGETNHVYYDEAEWAQVEQDRSNNELPKAQAAATARLEAAAQAEVNAIVQPPTLHQAMARAQELTLAVALGGTWTPEEAIEIETFTATLAATRAVRAREAVALAAVAAAGSVSAAEGVVL